MDEFFVKDTDGEKGPFTFDELTDGRLEPDDMVRTPMTGWEKASTIADFTYYFQSEGFYFPNEYNLAGFGIRFLAYLIDYFTMVVLLIIGILIYVSIAAPDETMDHFINRNKQLLQIAIAPVFLILYFTLLAASPLSGSLGQSACKLMIVDAEGQRLSFWQALGRGVGKFISGSFFGIGFLSILWSGKKQAFHDALAKTYVIRKDIF